MKTGNKIILFLIIVSILFIIQVVKEIKQSISTGSTFQNWYWNLSYVQSGSPAIVDNPLIYKDDDTTIYDLYLIILPTTTDDNEDITFEQLNKIIDFEADKPVLNAYILNTDKKGLSINQSIITEVEPNSTVTLRGHSTMQSEEKSYKITIDNDTFLNNNILNLNKHPFDGFRVRNKIAFELFEKIPNFTSMKTNLINLYIKDLTANEDGGFIDYGLFTNIEQPNKKFLKEHKFDPEGYLYKAEYFEFFRYEDYIKNIDDPSYDEILFSSVLEPKVAKDHKKIINMLDDVNNYNLDINKVLERHFNRDNYFTWLAINILLGNYDTQTQNYFLYSSHDNYAWYFLPWDYDGSMYGEIQSNYDSDGRFQALVGVSNYWGNVLHKRVFSDKDNLENLNKKIEQVYKILSKDFIKEVTLKYLPIVKREYNSNHIYQHEVPEEVFNQQTDMIINSIEDNWNLYYENIERPMPVYLGDMEKIGNMYHFFWDESFDLQGDRLSYLFQISKTPNFSEVVFEKKRLRNAYYELEIEIEPGEYFWRVIVEDSEGNTQRAFDQFYSEEAGKYFGLRKIIIE